MENTEFQRENPSSNGKTTNRSGDARNDDHYERKARKLSSP